MEPNRKKFGTFSGVFVPSFEAIIGTVVFLLLPLITLDIGLMWMTVIILLAHSVTISTSSSIADCVTNLNRVGGGGLYAICKASLGKALGGSIGISLFIAQVASVGFYVIGFSDTLYPLLADFWQALLPENLQGIAKPLFASAFLFLFFAIVLSGADFVVKLQNLIFVILAASLATLLLGPFLGLSFNGEAIYGAFSSLNIAGQRSMSPALFFMSFTLFFPAVTGISAGIGMSGELKTPQKSLVWGTFSAIGITFILYLLTSFNFSLLRPDLLLEPYAASGSNGTLAKAQGRLLTELFGVNSPFPQNIPGLMLFVGILFATGSSALSLFITAPRTLQSIIHDKLLNKSLNFLASDFTPKGKEPRFAILFTFVLSLAVIWAGDLSFAAILVGILFLLVYAWVNGAAFLERVSHNPSFRPSFRGHWLISLYGLISSVTVVTLFNWKLGLGLLAAQYLIFHALLKFKTNGRLEGVWWGIIFNMVNRGVHKLRDLAQGEKNWRPLMQVIGIYDEESDGWQRTARFARQIGEYGGLVEFVLLKDAKYEESYPELSLSQSLFSRTFLYGKKLGEMLSNILQYSSSIIPYNTLLLEFDRRIDHLAVLRRALETGKSTILYRPGKRSGAMPAENLQAEALGQIDIWWSNEQNGNFMLILSHIINKNRSLNRQGQHKIRILRYMRQDERAEVEKERISQLLVAARLEAELLCIPFIEGKDFSHFINEYSFDSRYVFTGLPGDLLSESSVGGIFKLDEYFFDRMLSKFSPEVTIFFVKSASKFNLLSE